jgi:type VI secretion system protein ImpH
MATASGAADPDLSGTPTHLLDVERELHKAPGEFNFFQAVRLLHLMSPGSETVGVSARPEREPVHFTVNPDLAFPASDIKSIDWGKRPPTMMVSFMGLTGPMGVLPRPYSELISERLRAKDTTLAAFLDIFNHRVISLFYQAWEKYRFAVVFERKEQDRLSRYLFSLIGLATRGLQGRLKVPDQALLFYTGLLALQPRSAAALESLLEDFFGVPVEVQQFSGSWHELSPADRCAVDGESFNAQLGITTVVGDAVWDEQAKIRIRLGPLSSSRYLEFLPEGAALESLRSLVAFFTNGEVEVDVMLVLKRAETPFCELGRPGSDGPRLGWFTWMKSRPEFDRDPGDTVLLLL